MSRDMERARYLHHFGLIVGHVTVVGVTQQMYKMRGQCAYEQLDLGGLLSHRTSNLMS